MFKKNIINLGINTQRLNSICLVLLLLLPLLPHTSAQSHNDDSTRDVILLCGFVFLFFVIPFSCLCIIAAKETNIAAAAAQRPPTIVPRSNNTTTRLDSKVIETYPVSVYPDVKNKEEVLSCDLCFKDFEDGDVLRLLPCNHLLHDCVDEWLVSQSTCPLCRFDLKAIVPETALNASGIVIDVLEDGQDHTHEMSTEMISEIQDELTNVSITA
ncbi:hypothetical protein MKW94_011406 [Papaver nudicaule]|uniref:RING-type E3 ubiquitin transferase n=1 Tax=Papaver nudicaule TaxID=74823 RepID=A0AA42B2H4_PAPNU|nr:hypothetical protein [Papaver nudicaule]